MRVAGIAVMDYCKIGLNMLKILSDVDGVEVFEEGVR
jgi:hypothetical protein